MDVTSADDAVQECAPTNDDETAEEVGVRDDASVQQRRRQLRHDDDDLKPHGGGGGGDEPDAN